MWMEGFFSQFRTSCLLFVASLTIFLRRQSKYQATALTFNKQFSRRVTPPHSILVELPFPGDQEIMRLKNDMVLSKVIGGEPKRYFLSVVDSGNAPAYAVGTYIADLYSKAWNEAAIKKCFDLDCIVLCDNIPGIVTAHDVLKRSDISQICTFRPKVMQEMLNGASRKVEMIDTSQFTSGLEKGLLENTKLQFVDSHFQVDLQAFPIYRYVAVGGSFDNLHNGHRKLLMFAAALCSEELTIGVTNDTMLGGKANVEYIGSFSDRVQSVRDYLFDIKPKLPLCIAKLDEPYGPAITDPKLQALIVSSETIMGAFKINEIRRSKGFNSLEIVVLNRADAAILSSSFIRSQKAKQVSI